MNCKKNIKKKWNFLFRSEKVEQKLIIYQYRILR